MNKVNTGEVKAADSEAACVKDCPNGCNQKWQKPGDEYCDVCEEKLESHSVNESSELSTASSGLERQPTGLPFYKVVNLYGHNYLVDKNNVVVLQDDRPPSVADMEAVAEKFNELAASRADIASPDLISRSTVVKRLREVAGKLDDELGHATAQVLNALADEFEAADKDKNSEISS